MRLIVFSFFLLLINLPVSADSIEDVNNQTLWNEIYSKFLGDNDPIQIYQNDIRIELDGNILPVDSAIFRDLVNQLNDVIEIRDVKMVSSSANLVFEINKKGNEGVAIGMSRISFNEQVEKVIKVNLEDSATYETRKKTYYYYLLRALVEENPNPSQSMYIPGCVFDEDNPEDIHNNPFDLAIIKTVYANDFEQRLKNYLNTRLLAENSNSNTKALFNIISILLAIIYLALVTRLRLFKKHNYQFRNFLNQGLVVLISYLIYSVCVQFLTSEYLLGYNFHIALSMLAGTLSFGFIAIVGIYFFEKIIFRNRDMNLFSNVLIIFLTTSLVPFLLLFVLNLMGMMAKFSSDDYAAGITYFTVFAVARTFYVYTTIKAEQEVRMKDLELSRVNELHKKAELESLQSKINPHFLYNALNSIASLAVSDGKKTEQMALALSDFFKYSLNKEHKTLVTIREEIDSVQTYLTIEKVRFGERFNYELNLPEELENVTIPQFIIQPVVENAVKHGISKLSKDGFIKLDVSKNGADTEIKIFDNGPAFPNEPVSGYGIQSIQEKLDLIYKGKASLTWHNKPDKYVLISIPINLK